MNHLHYILIILGLLLVHSAVLAHSGGMGMPNLRSLFGQSNTVQNRSIEMNQYAHARKTQIKHKGRVFVFEPRRLRWQAYQNGYLVASGRASGGRGYCADVGRSCRTPVGRFRVFRKGSPYCVSNKFPLGRGGAPMPHYMFFRGGYAIHGSPDVPNYNASHGCIRVHPRAARWLHQNFVQHGTRVIVRSY